jgi:hypothetical protein
MSNDGWWIMRKLRGLHERSLAPDLALPQKPPRYHLSKDCRPRPPAIPIEAPAGVPKDEWREAARNVELGSAPSEIRAGSDVPSDFSLRIMGLLTP